MVNADLSHRLELLNLWLAEIYGSNVRLSELLKTGGLSDNEILEIKNKHLAAYFDNVVNYIAGITEGNGGERRNLLMMAYFGFSTGEHKTLQSLGKEYKLSRERIRQLVESRLIFYRRRNQSLTYVLVALAHQVLGQPVDIPKIAVPSKQKVRSEESARPFTVDESISNLISQAAQWHWLQLPMEQRSKEVILQKLQTILPRILDDCVITPKQFVKPTAGAQAEQGKQNVGDRVQEARVTYENAYAVWKPEDDERLKEMFHAGANLDSLVEEFQRQPTALVSRLKKLGLF